MKRIYLYLTATLFILFTGLTTTGCKDEKADGLSEGLSVKVFSPSKIMEGEKVVITGTGLDAVTAVVFPGNKSVTAIEVTSSNMISVVAPAGIAAEGGELILESPGKTVVASVPLTLAVPKCTAMNPSGKLGSGDELTIVGNDLEYFDKIIFPGKNEDVVVNAIDFLRKSTGFIRLIVPHGLRDGLGQIKLVTAGGVELLLPEVELVAGPSGEWQWHEIGVIWEGSVLVEWGKGLIIEGKWFKGEELPLKRDDIVRCYITTTGGWPQIKFYTGSWVTIRLRDDFASDNGTNNVANPNHFVVDAEKGVTYLDFPMTEDLFIKFTSSDNILATGDGVTFKKITILRQVWVEYE